MARAHAAILDGVWYGVRFICPACSEGDPRREGYAPHYIVLPVSNWQPEGYPPTQRVPQWIFNGNMDRPTFAPSVLQRYDYGPNEDRKHFCCHSFVRDGQIQYLTDCTHAMAGQTVDLPEIDDVPAS